jgi:signal transduction histidine kinase
VVIKSIETISLGQQKILSHALKRIRNISADLNMEPSKKMIQKIGVKNIIEPIILEKTKSLQFDTSLKIEVDYNKCQHIKPTIDSVTLKRIMSNLIQNSIEADSLLIKVETYIENNQLIIIVRDNGKGIPHQILPRLAEKGITFGKASGSGLGLYHAKKQIEAMDGKLFIHKMDVGTKVELNLLIE